MANFKNEVSRARSRNTIATGNGVMIKFTFELRLNVPPPYERKTHPPNNKVFAQRNAAESCAGAIPGTILSNSFQFSDHYWNSENSRMAAHNWWNIENYAPFPSQARTKRPFARELSHLIKINYAPLAKYEHIRRNPSPMKGYLTEGDTVEPQSKIPLSWLHPVDCSVVGCSSSRRRNKTHNRR